MEKIKIAIVGIGGVGGKIAAKLSHHYEENEDIEIYFYCRNNHLKAIKDGGLRLKTLTEDFITHPTLASDNVSDFPPMDYIFYCTKSYDIGVAVEQILPMVGEKTIIIPILNGVDGAEQIRAKVPNNIVCDGLAFIISFIKEAGFIEETSKMGLYYFGDGSSDNPQLQKIEKICCDAGITIYYVPDIGERVWEKYGYISTVASITTSYNITYGDVLTKPHYRDLICRLIDEFESVAYKLEVLPHDSGRKQRILDLMASLPADSTTSMQRDFWSGKNSELNSLTNYIIVKASELGLEVPTYKMVYDNALAVKP